MNRTHVAARGFTLIELIAATALGALLMILLTGVLRSIVLQQRRAHRVAAQVPPSVILADQIRRDLQNARSVASDAQSLSLTGLLGQDPTSRLPTQRPARVIYTIQRISGTTYLVRTLEQDVEQRGRQTIRSVLWRGASRIDTVVSSNPLLGQSAQPTRAQGARSPIDTDSLANHMPSRVEVSIRSDQGVTLCRVVVIQ